MIRGVTGKVADGRVEELLESFNFLILLYCHHISSIAAVWLLMVLKNKS